MASHAPLQAAGSLPELTGLRVWMDIDNPAQVQYLQRLRAAFVDRGAEVFLTARASGMTTQLLETYDINARVFGGDLSKGKLAKAIGTIRRAGQLRAYLRSMPRPSMTISTSRAAAIASRWMRIDNFVLLDYEHVNLSVYRRTGSWILHPDVIPAESFVLGGIPANKLIPFQGLKEDITFSSVDINQTHPPAARDGRMHVLVRPPSERSHYHVHGSTDVTRQVLEYLAKRSDVQVHFSPRHLSQAEYLSATSWTVEPRLYKKPERFLDLLLRCDGVVSAGGTMLREAAYLGIPAFSTFQGKRGAVDVHLESCGRLVFIERAEELGKALDLGLSRWEPLASPADFMTRLIGSMVERAAAKPPPIKPEVEQAVAAR